MQEHDIKRIVAEVLAEQQRLHKDDLDSVVFKTIATILTSFGIEEEDRKEFQADFIYLRKWRKGVDAATGLTFKIIVGTLVSGALVALWVGIKAAVGK